MERLDNGEELFIGELAKEWNVDPKTIQRDFDKLKQMYPGKIERGLDKKRIVNRLQNKLKMTLK